MGTALPEIFKHWKQHKDTMLSDLGDFVSATPRKVRTCSVTGYQSVTIKGQRHYLHRLMWELFYGEIPEGCIVTHNDGDKTNNQLTNLSLTTQKGAVRKSINNGTAKPFSKKGTINTTLIRERLESGVTDYAGIALEANCSYQYVWLIAKGKRIAKENPTHE